MKTSELLGARLAYWVAQADEDRQGIRWERQGNDWIGYGTIGSSPEFPCWIITDESTLRARGALQDKHLHAKFYEPHKNWTEGGPIIEREHIEILFPDGMWRCGVGEQPDGDWRFCATGPTPLIAAMRAYVASKFGEEVPDEVSHD